MKKHHTSIHTVRMLKTICNLNEGIMVYADLAIVDTNYNVVFEVKRSRLGTESTNEIFICSVSHMEALYNIRA